MNATEVQTETNTKPRSLINRSRVKEVILNLASETRKAARFTRVGSDVYDRLEGLVRNEIESLVRTHPSLGRTIRYTDCKKSGGQRDE